MDTRTRPPFALYIVWHPAYEAGSGLANRLRQHFGGDGFRDVAGGLGLGVIYRNENAPRKAAPLSVEWDGSESTAVVVLVDANLDRDAAWRDYVLELARIANSRGYQDRFIPVKMEADEIQLQFEEQLLCWDQEMETDTLRERRLVLDLAHEFCRIVRHRLQSADRPEDLEPSIDDYLKPVQVFISHSNHDKDGRLVAERIRDWLNKNSRIRSFLAVVDIPPGESFEPILLHKLKTSDVVMIVHTDSYSSREWCRREVVIAKRYDLSMIVLDCLQDIDWRSLPYMGNVPVIRMNPKQGRIADAIGHLLDEVLRTFIWQCRVQRFKDLHPNVLFTARPPELITLATRSVAASDAELSIVHPEPPLGKAETSLFSNIAPDMRIQTLTKWLEEAT